MNFKHLSIGAILIFIGIAILSPIDDLIVLLPLATILGPEIFPAVMGIGAVCLALGIFLVGKSTLMHYGLIGRTVAHHPVIVLSTVIIVSVLVYCWLNGGI